MDVVITNEEQARFLANQIKNNALTGEDKIKAWTN